MSRGSPQAFPQKRLRTAHTHGQESNSRRVYLSLPFCFNSDAHGGADDTGDGDACRADGGWCDGRAGSISRLSGSSCGHEQHGFGAGSEFGRGHGGEQSPHAQDRNTSELVRNWLSARPAAQTTQRTRSETCSVLS